MNQATLSIKKLFIQFENYTILKDQDLEIHGPQWIEIIGKNNSGKSTFLNTLYGIHKAYSGQIIYDGELLNDISLQGIRTKLGFFSLSLPLLLDKTLRANLSIALSVHNSSFVLETNEFLTYCLKELSLESKLLVPVYKLSESDQVKVKLARSLIHMPKILLLDCAFRGLDLDSRKEILSVLVNFFENNSCTIIMTADEPSAFVGSERKVFLLDQAQLKLIK